MEITGVVKFRSNGAVNLQLRPQTVPVTVTAPTAVVAVQPNPEGVQPPTVDAVRAKILGDGWAVHPSREPLTDSEIKIAVSNAQIQHVCRRALRVTGSTGLGKACAAHLG